MGAGGTSHRSRSNFAASQGGCNFPPGCSNSGPSATFKRQQKPIQLEDEASAHGGEHQRGVQGRRSGVVGTHWVLRRHGRTFPAAN